jgi:single-stranded DNA-binding protein
MSFSILIHGTLYAAPESRTSTKGKPYARARMSLRDGESKTWISMTAFDQAANHLLQLQEGEAVTVAGRAKVKPYSDKSGEPAASLDVMVDRLIGIKPPRVAKTADDDSGDPLAELENDVPF